MTDPAYYSEHLRKCIMNIDPAEIAAIVREEVVRYLKAKSGSGSIPVVASAESYSSEKDTLVVFLGSTRGLESVNPAIRKMVDSGRKVDAYFSPSACYVINREKVLEETGIRSVLEDIPPGKASVFVKQYKMILIPSLTRNTAAKLALGISDNMLGYMLLVAMGNKIPLLAGKDGLYTDAESSCSECALDLPGMDRILGSYERILTEFGMRIFPAKEMDTAIERYLKKEPESGDALEGIITAEDAESMSGTRIVVSEKAIITPLAVDILRAKGIIIQRIEN